MKTILKDATGAFGSLISIQLFKKDHGLIGLNHLDTGSMPILEHLFHQLKVDLFTLTCARKF
jgi:hypothetical protein